MLRRRYGVGRKIFSLVVEPFFHLRGQRSVYLEIAPASEVLGSQTSIDFGMNAGVGVYLWVAPPLRMYLEARYHYVWGPAFRGEAGETRHANAEYVPAVLGVGF